MNKNLSNKQTRNIISLVLVVICIYAILFGIFLFNKYLLNKFDIGIKMIFVFLTYWLLLIPILIINYKRNKKLILGFTKDNLLKQILTGFVIGISLSILFTVVPILLGAREMVGGTPKYTEAWKIAYDFVYCLIAIAFVEEVIFRGYIYNQLLEIKNSKWLAIIISSVLFGLFHIFNGDIFQVIVTTLIGIVYCILRDKIKYCSLLSLIIIHGINDAMITVWLILL